MSTFAFGTYRISDQNPLHIEALKEAVEGGIELIDTSTNYTDGGAERAIGKVLQYTDDDIRSKIKIVSKYGYIQGSNLTAFKENPFDGVIEFSESCYHSISKEFLHEQLTQSLQRLQMDKIDCYLIHNPEYFIYDALKKELPKDEMLDAMYERLYDAFLGLEREVKEQRIDSYGISSNSFSKKSSDAEFLPYEDLLVLAQKAAQEIGNDKHSFTTIELPINILEQEGLKCAKWAKENGLRVLSNRPLNAQYNNLMFRLADYDDAKEYDYYLNELLEISDDALLKPLYNLIEQMDAHRHKFGWIGEYDTFLTMQIMPHIKNVLEKIDNNALEDLLRYIEIFLNEYRKTVAYECSLRLRTELKDVFKECKKRLQECALEFLLQKEEIDYILVGMRRPIYVQEILTLKEKLN